MAIVDTVVATAHLLVGALWVGSIVFFAAVVLPGARDGTFNAAPLESMTRSLTLGSRLASVFMLTTGAYLALTRYAPTALSNTSGGNLVTLMVFLWVVLTALVEVGDSKLSDGVAQKKVRQPAHDAIRFYRGAAVVGVALFVNAGVLLG